MTRAAAAALTSTPTTRTSRATCPGRASAAAQHRLLPVRDAELFHGDADPDRRGRGFGPAGRSALAAGGAHQRGAGASDTIRSVAPIGRRIRPGGDSVWFTVVGVAKDVKQGGVDSKTGTELYLDYPTAAPRLRLRAGGDERRGARPTLDKSALAPRIRRVVRGARSRRCRSSAAEHGRGVRRLRVAAALPRATARRVRHRRAVALGDRHVWRLAYSVTERRREIGIRMALGASGERVLGMVLRQGLTLGVAGVVIGVSGAALITRLMGTHAVWREADRRRDVRGGGGLHAPCRVRGGVRPGTKGDEGRSIDGVESGVSLRTASRGR